MAGALGLDRLRTAPQQPDLRQRRVLAWGLFGLTVTLMVAGVALMAVALDAPAPVDFGFRGFQLLLVIPLSAVALLLTLRLPANPIGWLLAVAALLGGLQYALLEYTIYAVLHRDGLVGGVWTAWVADWLWMPLVAILGAYLVLLFPDGQLPSARWRPVAWGGIVAVLASVVVFALRPGPLENFSAVDNPIGQDSLAAEELESVLGGYLLLIVAAAVSLVGRYRKSAGEERQQLKVVVFAAAALAATLLVQFVSEGVVGPGASGWRMKAAQILTISGITSVPVAAGIAVLRYGLYEIDVVINKTIVVGALAAFVTAVYAGLVAGVGGLIGDRSNLAMSMVAAGVVAVAFQPVRERVQRVANRLVYGERATPYEVLSTFSARLGQTLAGDEQLAEMARLLAEGTGAARAEVRVRVGGELQTAATWGDEAGGPDLVVPVVHHGEHLGSLAITKRRDEPLTPTEEKLVRDLAGQAGLVLRNGALIADLRASRQRLVSAQDEERRRLERNLHDGAQQQLVALKVQLGLARTVAEREGSTQAAALLVQLAAEADDALNNLRDLARGIYPPLLAAEGLPAALGSQAQKAPVATEVDAERVGRYPAEVEATVYFCCLEALQNVGKYAAANRATIRLREDAGNLVFTVTDDGCGFQVGSVAKGAGMQNMADRLDAVGGSLSVESEPGEGTAVTGRIPVTSR